MLAGAGRRLCNGRVAVVTEGGYHLGALREGLEGMIDKLSES
jgi:acetoin utilization deacetylase AcuC-like enzyme